MILTFVTRTKKNVINEYKIENKIQFFFNNIPL